jgi:ribosomal protein S18 acetylase RimI-like enzyme
VPAPRPAERLRPLGADPDGGRFAEAVVPLVHDAGRPYFDWLFGGPEAARRRLAGWSARASSEVALERVTVLFEDGEPAGLFVALPGAELAACRKADAVALLQETESSERRAVMERLAAVRSLFAPVAEGEWYLSKLAVLPARRGRGLGGRLADAYLAAGAEQGFTRYRLDVDAGNTAALGLYESRNFRIAHDRSSEAAGLRYLGLVREP